MKKIFLGVLALITSVALFAVPRTAEQAAEIAAQFTNAQPQLSRMHKAPRTAATMKLAHTALKPASDEAAFYVFNQENNSGAVFVSADDRTLDVLGYTDKGQFDPENVNPNLKWWLENYSEQMAEMTDEIAQHASVVRKAVQVTAIGPLLKDKNGIEITWYQEAPYYNLCPQDCGGRALTGCVATAASQIMFSWRWPEHGTGTKTYTWNKCTSGFDWWGYCYDSGTPTNLTADYENTYYDWDNMLPAYKGKTSTTAQKNAVATLMYHAGVACEMEYGSGGSGSWTDDMAVGLRDHFGYKFEKFISFYSKSGYSSAKPTAVKNITAEWSVTAAKMAEYFNADLEAGRPILMGGESNSGGHEFVCDGRNSSGKFHINWGWEGDDNGYFELTVMGPAGGDYFKTHLDALIGLEPDGNDPIAVTDVTVTPGEVTIKVNEKLQLAAAVAPAEATNKKITWSSSDASVVTVTETGLIKGVSEGNATITVTTKDGGFTANCEVTVSGEMELSPNFVLLTDLVDLEAKDEIILVCSEKGIAANNTYKTGNTSNYFGKSAVTIKDDEIELSDESDVLIFTLGGSTGAWTLTTPDGKQLGATDVRKIALDAGTKTWKISLDGTAATILNGTAANGDIRYQSQMARFTTYTTDPSDAQRRPEIYFRKHKDTPSAIEQTAVNEPIVIKTMENGHIVIIRDNKTYDILGKQIH